MSKNNETKLSLVSVGVNARRGIQVKFYCKDGDFYIYETDTEDFLRELGSGFRRLKVNEMQKSKKEDGNDD